MKSNKVLVLFLVVMLACFLGTAVVKHFMRSETTPPPLPPPPGPDTIVVEPPKPVVDPKPVVFPPDISTVKGVPELIVTKNKYYYKLNLKNLPGGNIEYTLSDNSNTYSVLNGKFAQVAPNNTGQYRLVARDKDTGLKSEVKVIKGFNIKAPIEKMTIAEVNSAVATGDCDTYITPILNKCWRKKCVVRRGGEKTSLNEIFTSVLLGEAVRATNIEYNCLGYITLIEFN